MRIGIACLTACLLSSTALAQSADPMRQLGAHVHGAAQLAVAADADGAVLAELTTPAFNLYVFEHAPETPEQHAVIAQTARTLASPSMIGLSRAARCELTGTQVGGGPAEVSDEHERHHEHEHEHEADHEHMHEDASAHHDHNDHHEHHDDHDHHDHGDESDHAGHGHADVVVSWTFDCARPERLSEVDLSGLFEAFSQFETVEVQYFDGARAAAQDVSPARPVLRLD